jgi:hypothetical protein
MQFPTLAAARQPYLPAPERGAPGPVPYLLRLKYRYAQVGTELAYVVRGSQASESSTNDSNVHTQAVCERVWCHRDRKGPEGLTPGMG